MCVGRGETHNSWRARRGCWLPWWWRVVRLRAGRSVRFRGGGRLVFVGEQELSFGRNRVGRRGLGKCLGWRRAGLPPGTASRMGWWERGKGRGHWRGRRGENRCWGRPGRGRLGRTSVTVAAKRIIFNGGYRRRVCTRSATCPAAWARWWVGPWMRRAWPRLRQPLSAGRGESLVIETLGDYTALQDEPGIRTALAASLIAVRMLAARGCWLEAVARRSVWRWWMRGPD